MKRILLFLIPLFFFFGCKSKNGVPDVSKIDVNIKVLRFDRDFLAIDTNNINTDLNGLMKKYPVVTPIFLQNILGLDSSSLEPGIRSFLSMSGQLFDTINTIFKNTDDIEKDFRKAFQYVKFYFPKYPVPQVATVAGPVDALAESETGPTPNFMRPGVLGVSLQFYLGKNFSVYNDPRFVEQVVPTYRSRRFSKEYIVADAMPLVTADMFPYQGSSKPLIEQMVEKGKRWWLLDKFLPWKADSVKTGYTQQQLNWCKDNEGLIWSFIIKNEDLQSLNPTTIQTYLGEGPFTQGFNQDLSPGNLGQWIGWQIVKKFADKNKSLRPEEVMNMDAKRILEEARYKPK